MAIAPNPAPESLSAKDPLPASIPKIRDGHLAAVYYGQRRSGDFYDFVRATHDRVVFGLFDVAGDLRETRPVMLALQQSFRQQGAALFATTTSNEVEALLELWLQLNRTVMQAAAGVRSCPAFLCCYNEEVKMLTYLNAGHTPGLFRDGAQVSPLGATALPLGLFSHSVPDASIIRLGAGNAVLVASQGVVEARHRGEEFGLDRVMRYVQEVGFESAHETCLGLLARVQQFMGTAPTHNDVTAVALLRSL
ncbi:MAG TPA: SpoIIE family protein phosphatase [Terriglobales bacterium]